MMMVKDVEFEFDIVVSLPKGAADEDAIMDALFEAGCDDAVVGLGASGIVGLGFTRAGEDAEVVISDAVTQVLSALPTGAQLREVKPDLVSLADVAARLSVSRQALQKRDMPPPSLGGLYRASEMLPALEAQPGKVRDALEAARGWFASAAAAQRINARASLGVDL
jgi:hypothetical protein